MPADFRVSITNAPATAAYPIASFTWLLLYQNPKDKAQAKAMVGLPEVGAAGRAEVRAGHGLRAAAEGGGRSRAEGAGDDQDAVDGQTPPQASVPTSSMFRVGTGCVRRSSSSSACWRSASSCIASHGCRSRSSAGSSGRPTRGIRSPASSAPGRSSGARSTRRSWRSLISTPIALGIAIYISELAPAVAARAAGVPDRAPRGDPVDRLRPLGRLRARAVRPAARGRDAGAG